MLPSVAVDVFPTPWVACLAVVAVSCLALALRSPRRRGLLVAIAATGVGLAAAEVGAWRWFASKPLAPPPTVHEEPRTPGGVVLPPSILPARDRMPAARGARPRALFIGDSFTEGLGVPTSVNFASLVGRSLDIEVINHGVAGTGTLEQELLWSSYSKTWQPDVVVWVFVLNDFFPQIPLGPDYLMRYEPGPLLGSYLLGMVRVVLARRAVQAATIEGYQRSLDRATNPEWFARLESALTEVHSELAARGGRLVLVIFPLIWNLQDYPFSAGHAQVAAAAASTGAEVIDLLPEFRGQEASHLWVSKFDHHPNERGHAVAARRLAEALRAGPLVTTPARRPPPLPAQWLSTARELHANQGTTLEGLRVAMILAAGAARLAELEGGPGSDALSEQALSLARQYQDDLAQWRPQPPPRSDR